MTEDPHPIAEAPYRPDCTATRCIGGPLDGASVHVRGPGFECGTHGDPDRHSYRRVFASFGGENTTLYVHSSLTIEDVLAHFDDKAA